MAEPVRGRLRPAAGPGGLTSPDPVTALPQHSTTRHHATAIPGQIPGQAAEQSAARRPWPRELQDRDVEGALPGNDHSKLRSGLRFSGEMAAVTEHVRPAAQR